MHTLFIVLGFVLYTNGSAEFFTSKLWVDQKACDEFALSWGQEKHDEDGVDKVYAQCVDLPGSTA